MTSETWSTPVLLIPPHEIPKIAAWRPTVTQHAFSEADQRSKVTWLEKFEAQMGDASGISDRLRADIRHLREIIAGNVSKYQTGPSLQDIIDDLVGASRGDVYRPVVVADQLPPDMLAQYYASADHPEVPVDPLLSIPRRWEPPVPEVLMVGAMILCRSTPTASIRLSGSDFNMPFLMAMVVDCRLTADEITVQYWVPPLARISRVGGGRKRLLVDLFGDWAPFDTLMISDAELLNSPDIAVQKADILEVITLETLGQIPYTALDKLRREHMIDVTAIGLCRAHVLTTNT